MGLLKRIVRGVIEWSKDPAPSQCDKTHDAITNMSDAFAADRDDLHKVLAARVSRGITDLNRPRCTTLRPATLPEQECYMTCRTCQHYRSYGRVCTRYKVGFNGKVITINNTRCADWQENHYKRTQLLMAKDRESNALLDAAKGGE